MYNPIVGRFMEPDPIGFKAGDPDLERFVGNDPTNAVDPSGLKFWMVGAKGKVLEGKAAEDEFFKQLGSTKPLQKVLAVLRENADFQKLWGFIRDADFELQLKLSPRLKRPDTGQQVFGGFANTLLQINPDHPKARDNPLEFVDTLVHESIHAVLYIFDQLPVGKPSPLPGGVLDIARTPGSGRGESPSRRE